MSKRGRIENLTPVGLGNKLAEKPFDKNQFEAMCRINCTEAEIMSVLGYKNHDTLNTKLRKEYGKTFEEVYPEFAGQGKMSLRRLQWKSAEAGNTGMQIWLGKQWLGQTDKTELTTDLTINVTLPQELLDDAEN